MKTFMFGDLSAHCFYGILYIIIGIRIRDKSTGCAIAGAAVTDK
jgi:hypothetical protein